jgi:hypothetical protein
MELSNTGYSCVVSGALSFKLAIHLTHRHHPEYERAGKPLGNITKAIFQKNKSFISLTILIVTLRKIVVFLMVINILIMMMS